MKKLFKILVTILVVFCSLAQKTSCQPELNIWHEFISILKEGEFPSERIRPYYENLRQPIEGYLKQMREKASWQEWEAVPEIFRLGNKIHFIIPLTFENQAATFCLTFLVEADTWYFQHIEAITIRMDKMEALPTSTFPDVPEATKAHMREEGRVSELVRWFNYLAKDKGKDVAFNWLKDGYGYALAAQTWVPFFPLAKSFVLFLCWEQSQLRGNEVTLEKLTEDEALVRLRLHYFNLYQVAAHLKQQISFEDYYKIFEIIWQDRAEKAGWQLEIKYEGEECSFRFWKN